MVLCHGLTFLLMTGFISMISNAIERTELAFRAGGSDKVYIVTLLEVEGGFRALGENGPRGGTMVPRDLSKGVVDEATARAVCAKKVQDQVKKGYKRVEGLSSGYVPPADISADAVPSVQLLEPIERDGAEAFIRNPSFVAQEKYDGERRVVRSDALGVTGHTRDGRAVGVPNDVADAVVAMRAGGGALVLDGEAIGDTLVAFDLLEEAGADLRALPFRERYGRLEALVGGLQGSFGGVRLAGLAVTEVEKRELFSRVGAEDGEGVVFKRANAPYIPGRAASGNDQLKCKFVETATVVVGEHHPTKRSVSMLLRNGKDGEWVAVGSVSIPGAKPLPPEGTPIEVRYLYAFRGGSLFQPVYLGVRSDISANAAQLAQLKYKQAVPDAPSGRRPGRG